MRAGSGTTAGSTTAGSELRPATSGPAGAAGARGARRRGLRRLGWGVVDQGMSSLTNVAVAVAVARMLGAEQFGAFSLAYVTYAFALNASRGLATDPLMARFGGADRAAWRRAVTACTGTAALVGLLAGTAVLAASALVGGPARGAFVALGLTLPGLLLQDSWRYAFFVAGRGGHAFLNDLAWAVVLVPALAAVAATGRRTVFWFVLAWGLAATVAAVLGVVQARLVPRPTRVREWWSGHRDLGVRYLLEGTSSSVSAQLRTYGIGAVLGLAAVGHVQGANTLMGPFVIVLSGTSAVIVPEIARVVRRSPAHLLRVCLAFGAGLAAVGAVWTVVLLALLPRGLGELVLGDVWRPAYPLVPLVALTQLGVSLQFGAGAGLHALQAARRSLRAMLASSALHLVLGVGGAVVGGTGGTVLGTAVAAWLGALLWWWHLGAARRAAARPPASRAGEPAVPGPGEPAGFGTGDPAGGRR